MNDSFGDLMLKGALVLPIVFAGCDAYNVGKAVGGYGAFQNRLYATGIAAIPGGDIEGAHARYKFYRGAPILGTFADMGYRKGQGW